MTRWEHKMERWDRPYVEPYDVIVKKQEVIDWLNSFGADGWELVGFTGSSIPNMEYFWSCWRRPINA
jgi:hypothetical protein